MIANKFVKWDIEPLKTYEDQFPFMLREKISKGGVMTREEKNRLYELIRHNHAPVIRLMGWEYWFNDVCNAYYVEQYGHIQKEYAPDKTSIRSNTSGRITNIVLI